MRGERAVSFIAGPDRRQSARWRTMTSCATGNSARELGLQLSGPSQNLRVLQVGPLYSIHTRRWAEQAASLGCTVYLAGHERAGLPRVDVHDVATGVFVLPENLHGSGTVRQARWLRDVVALLAPDVVQAHGLTTWRCRATFLWPSRRGSHAMGFGCLSGVRRGTHPRRSRACAGHRGTGTNASHGCPAHRSGLRTGPDRAGRPRDRP
jgi:hypothetical protein